ncbi:MAG: adenylyltransferase/cytidyltransferase family protein [Candidatus Bathyarchaeia archaeon]
MRIKKRKVVLAEGTFDLLHYGHVYYLTNAKKTGGENAKLVVVIARDKTVERLKGSKPVIPEDQRRAIVESLKVVDEAILGYEDVDISRVIDHVKPDIIALGYDKEKMEKELRDYIAKKNLNIQVFRMGKFEKEEIDSSTKIKKKIIEKHGESVIHKNQGS